MGKIKGIKGNDVATKIEEKELKELHEHIGDLNYIISQVGEIEVRKYYAVQAHQQGERKLREFRDKLQKKYGSVNINTKTGEISPMKSDGKP